MVDFLIGHYTYRMFPTAIDIISTSLAVAYSDEKYTYQNWSITTWHTLQPRHLFPASDDMPLKQEFKSSTKGGGGMACGNILLV